MATKTYLITTLTSWTIPSDYAVGTPMTITCIGGGGGGGRGASGNFRQPAGGGGGWSQSTVAQFSSTGITLPVSVNGKVL